MSIINGLFILVIIIIIWIYYKVYRVIPCDKIMLDVLFDSHSLKTGDLILFKATNQLYSAIHGAYFGHIGMVYILETKDGEVPLLFEANNPKTYLLPHHSTRGIYLTPLRERIEKYKGKVFLKSLEVPLSDEKKNNLEDFIKFSMENLYYDDSVVNSGLRKGLAGEKCNFGTNCGEIIFLSLIKLGLIPVSKYEENIFHHLNYVCYIDHLQSNGYNPLIEIVDHPFAY